MHHNAIAFVYENYKASEIGQEKEAKDASTIINVKLHVVAIFFSFFLEYPNFVVLYSWPLLMVELLFLVIGHVLHRKKADKEYNDVCFCLSCIPLVYLIALCVFLIKFSTYLSKKYNDVFPSTRADQTGLFVEKC